MTAHPFDVIAREYDADFTHHPLGKMLRASVWRCLKAYFQPGDWVLDLGCGSGEDAVWLAQQGIHVIGADISDEMLAVAREKAAAAGVHNQTAFIPLDLQDVQAYSAAITPIKGVQRPKLDAAYANFGALNCLADRRAVGRALAEFLKPGAVVILVLMGPFCPWEIGWHLLHGKPGAAFRRWRAGISANLGAGGSLQVWYPSPARLRRELQPYFKHLKTTGIGVLLPPSYLSDLVDHRPQLFSRLNAWEQRLARTLPGRWLNDHYLSVFQRTQGSP